MGKSKNQRLKFRRATHKKGVYNTRFKEDNLTGFQKKVWERHGDICHMLDSDKGMEFDDIFNEIRKDVTNYIYAPEDLDGWRDGSTLPTVAEVAVALVRLLEAGFVEVDIPPEPPKFYDYKLWLEPLTSIGGKSNIHILRDTDREGVKLWIEGYRETSHYNDEINVEEFEIGEDVKPRDSMYF